MLRNKVKKDLKKGIFDTSFLNNNFFKSTFISWLFQNSSRLPNLGSHILIWRDHIRMQKIQINSKCREIDGVTQCIVDGQVISAPPPPLE